MTNNETKQCPFCGETILAIAKKCKFCGEILNAESDTALNNNTSVSDDVLLLINTKPHGMNVMCCLALGGLFQAQWLLNQFKYKNWFKFTTNKENNLSILKKMNLNDSSFFTFLQLYSICMILATFMLMFTWTDTWGAIVFFCYLFLSVFYVKIAGKIQKYIQIKHNCFIECNKVWAFLFQSMYLNYFFLNYKTKLERAKNK